MSTTEHTESTEPEKTGDRVYFRVFSLFRGEIQNPESQPLNTRKARNQKRLVIVSTSVYSVISVVEIRIRNVNHGTHGKHGTRKDW